MKKPGQGLTKALLAAAVIAVAAVVMPSLRA
jgi:hypothetical protein